MEAELPSCDCALCSLARGRLAGPAAVLAPLVLRLPFAMMMKMMIMMLMIMMMKMMMMMVMMMTMMMMMMMLCPSAHQPIRR